MYYLFLKTLLSKFLTSILDMSIISSPRHLFSRIYYNQTLERQTFITFSRTSSCPTMIITQPKTYQGTSSSMTNLNLSRIKLRDCNQLLIRTAVEQSQFRVVAGSCNGYHTKQLRRQLERNSSYTACRKLESRVLSS